MEDIRTFRKGDLQNVKEVLRESFFVKGKNEVYNEWEFAEQILLDKGFREKLCLVASVEEEIVGYCILTDARIEDEEGLALGQALPHLRFWRLSKYSTLQSPPPQRPPDKVFPEILYPKESALQTPIRYKPHFFPSQKNFPLKPLSHFANHPCETFVCLPKKLLLFSLKATDSFCNRISGRYFRLCKCTHSGNNIWSHVYLLPDRPHFCCPAFPADI